MFSRIIHSVMAKQTSYVRISGSYDRRVVLLQRVIPRVQQLCQTDRRFNNFYFYFLHLTGQNMQLDFKITLI